MILDDAQKTDVKNQSTGDIIINDALNSPLETPENSTKTQSNNPRDGFIANITGQYNGQ